jgi:site-specific DNA-cytosine methylase
LQSSKVRKTPRPHEHAFRYAYVHPWRLQRTGTSVRRLFHYWPLHLLLAAAHGQGQNIPSFGKGQMFSPLPRPSSVTPATCARLPGTLPWHSALALCCPTFKTPLSMMVIFAALLGLATAVPHSGAGKVEVKFFAEAVSQAVSLLCRRAAHPHHLRVRRIAAVTRVPDGRDGPGQPDPVGRGHRGHHGL